MTEGVVQTEGGGDAVANSQSLEDQSVEVPTSQLDGDKERRKKKKKNKSCQSSAGSDSVKAVKEEMEKETAASAAVVAKIDNGPREEAGPAAATADDDDDGVDCQPDLLPKSVEEEEEEEADEEIKSGTKKKKRSKRKKKKNTSSSSSNADDCVVEEDERRVVKGSGLAGKLRSLPRQDNSRFRLVGSWSSVENTLQTEEEPTVAIHELYASLGCRYPEGQLLSYRKQPSEGRRSDASEMVRAEDYNNARRAAECHRQVRKYIQKIIQPGMTTLELCQKLEAKSAQLIAAEGLESGWAFPTGCSINSCAAHYTPNYGEKDVLIGELDLCKLDFGVHVAGRIVDCAFSIAFDERYDSLIEATKEGTKAGISAAGIDVMLGDIGEAIQEVIEAYEIDLDGKTYRVRPIRNLNGHSIAPYQIHAGKSVPIVKCSDSQGRMEEGEFYAIETFASTGKGYVQEDMECSHYMRNATAAFCPLKLKTARSLLNAIDHRFSTLPFCRRWLDDMGQTRHLMALKYLVDSGTVTAFPPLCDVKGSYTSQSEHTILLRPMCKEIITKGEDY